jgi:DNA-directed RNA polymerase subunit RPC12/RpoP
MLPTHDVHCPSCDKFLYSALSLEDVLDADSATAPRVEEDGNGSYLRCPHCRARVAMQPVVSAGRRGFRLAG